MSDTKEQLVYVLIITKNNNIFMAGWGLKSNYEALKKKLTAKNGEEWLDIDGSLLRVDDITKLIPIYEPRFRAEPQEVKGDR